MEEKRFKELHKKYINNTLTPIEDIEWNILLSDSKYVFLLNKLMDDSWENLNQHNLQTITEAKSNNIYQSIVAKPLKSYSKLKAVLASAAALIIISFGFYYYTLPKIKNKNFVVNTDILPGKNTATLILSNGKTIQLSDKNDGAIISGSKLSYYDGSKIDTAGNLNKDFNKNISDINIKSVTANTPRGGQYKFTLPDGTQVWLNAQTSLKFPSDFINAKERKVYLNGEAYFEVAKDKSKPFIVSTKHQDVKVLGTHFNVSSYEDETLVKTTLIEGSVVVNYGGKSLILKPDQQSNLRGEKITVKNVDVDESVAWVHGNISFMDEDLEGIMKKISKWYDVDIYYKGEIPKTTFYGQFSRSKKLSEVLNVLKISGKVNFEVEGRRVVVKK